MGAASHSFHRAQLNENRKRRKQALATLMCHLRTQVTCQTSVFGARMAFAGSCSMPGMGTGLLGVGNWNAWRFSNPAGSFSANLSILARDQTGTKLPSLLLIPSLVSTGLGQPPALQDLSVLLCLAQGLKKAPRNATNCPRAPGMARHRKGPGLSVERWKTRVFPVLWAWLDPGSTREE